MSVQTAPAIWFPTVRTGTGTDVFTERLVGDLRALGLRAEATWLPLRAEYAPWTVRVPEPPSWATICHINTWLHPRFIPKHLPVVATLHHSIHDPALRVYKGRLRADYHRWWIAPIERRVLQRADRVVAVSHFVARTAKQELCDVPMDVVYNGIDTSIFPPSCRSRHVGEPFRLLYVGSWMTRKGVDLLAPIMRELGRGFVLHFTGGEAAAKDRENLPANMHDIGRLSFQQVVAAMQQVDAFLFPSRSEGLPLVVIEAMAGGLPVIGMRGTVMDELLDDGARGMLCGRDQPGEFAAAVRRLAADPGLRAALAANARSAAVHIFEHSRMRDAYLRLYRDVLAS